MSPLADHLKRLIVQTGPLSVAAFMSEALAHPQHGYYVNRDPLGAKGDFVTAPEISQIFGELIGLWLIEAWERQGAPSQVILCELGPGRGTLMADVLRAAQVRPAFIDAADLHLVEVSPVLRARQRESIGRAPPQWHATLETVPPDRPLFLIANEFFDALPIRQFVRGAEAWHERSVGLDEADRFAFGLTKDPVPHSLIPESLRNAPTGSLIERRPAGEALLSEVALRIAASGGAALVVDYGHDRHAIGDTFQAVKSHAFTDPLAGPGDADLTAHVDFAALATAAREAGASVFGPAPQGEFLDALGITLRAERLAAANPKRAQAIHADVERLTSPLQMGSLFRVLALVPPNAPTPAGF